MLQWCSLRISLCVRMVMVSRTPQHPTTMGVTLLLLLLLLAVGGQGRLKNEAYAVFDSCVCPAPGRCDVPNQSSQS